MRSNFVKFIKRSSKTLNSHDSMIEVNMDPKETKSYLPIKCNVV